MAEVLLQGETPLDSSFRLAKNCHRMFQHLCCKKEKVRVHPSSSGTSAPVDGNAASPAEPSVLDLSLHVGTKGAEAVETLRADLKFKRKFVTATISMLGIAEASSIFIATAFTKIQGVNFGPVGSPRVSDFLLLFNLAIMVFGEVVVTDGMVAYLSSIWKDRYTIDVSAEWEKRDVFMYWCFFPQIVFRPFNMMFGILSHMCFTSYVGEANFLDPVITTCPLVPELSDMLSVGAAYFNATQP